MFIRIIYIVFHFVVWMITISRDIGIPYFYSASSTEYFYAQLRRLCFPIQHINNLHKNKSFRIQTHTETVCLTYEDYEIGNPVYHILLAG